MPLTISHPAASVPLTRLGLVLSALVVGSMTPDFPYFIPLFLHYSGFSHSISGLLAFCVPLGLVTLGIFHFFIKYPAFSLLPINHQNRLYEITRDFTFWPFRRFLLIIISIYLGAFTHILWDSFTHAQGWIVQQFVFLKLPLFGLQTIPIYELLQYGSTLLGGIFLLYWYSNWYKYAKPSPVPKNLTSTNFTKITLLATMSTIALITAASDGLDNMFMIQASFYRRILNGHLFVVSVSTFILEIMVFSAYWHFRHKKDNAI
ncbi:MAG: DUF4184 family protein [Anaerolineales bacterium]